MPLLTSFPIPRLLEGAVKFLRGQAEAIGLECRVVEPLPGKPVVVMSWPGTEPALPTLLLNSHTDVVPVFEVGWVFSAGVI